MPPSYAQPMRGLTFPGPCDSYRGPRRKPSPGLRRQHAGRERARQYLEINQYTGAAPVPLASYIAAMHSLASARGSYAVCIIDVPRAPHA